MENNPFIQGLRAAGLKITAQRIAICAWLHQNNIHPAAADVHEALRDAFPTMSMATIYNTLELLAELKLIYPVGVRVDGSTRYDTRSDPHANLICRRCGKVIDVLDEALLNEARRAVDQAGFNAQDLKVVVHGICPTCQQHTEQGL